MASYTTTPGNYIKFLRGTPTAWAKIPVSDRDKDTLYFISEADGSMGQLYLGSKLIIGEISDIENIGDLHDVLLSENITGNSILIYDKAQEQWVNKPMADVLDTIITLMKGASDTLNGTSGLVPAPKKGDNKLFLRGDASWANPTEAVELTLNTIIGEDVGKSMRDISQEEVLKVIDNAPEAFDTLKEIADWITTNTSAEDIIKLNARVTDLEQTVGDAEAGLVKDVADLQVSSSKVENTLYGDGAKSGLVTTVSNLENDLSNVRNQVRLVEDRLKWQDIDE